MEHVGTADIRVGLLAYGAIGHEHNLAVQHTPGLVLTAVCDMNPERVAAALELAPDAATFSDAEAMLASGTLDLVVISTPPNSHYQWAKAALGANLHVVLEKPMALTADECDELMALAAQRDRLLVVYQNRRYDPDFVTVRALLAAGEIGDLFQLDTFVGGYSEPCTYWHSDALISGGAIFDWGSHYLDQILNLIPDPVDHVIGINQKRKWMHATNADHAQVTLTFTTGRQATFTNSDLAAVRKPKFYALGSEGAILGDWDPAAEPAVADLPAIITVHHGNRTSVTASLANVPAYGFHQSLVDYLVEGIAMEVTATQSRDVVAIMQAAEESALNNGRPVTPHLLRSATADSNR